MPENLIENPRDYISIGNKYLSKDHLESIVEKINENIKTINSVGVDNYFYNEFFLEHNYLDELINKIDGFNVINNQLIIDKNIDVDLDVYQNIINQISDDLSVNYVDIKKFDRQSGKKTIYERVSIQG